MVSYMHLPSRAIIVLKIDPPRQQSGSPTYPIRDMLEGQRYYDRLVEQTNCSGAADTLQCLRDAPYEKLMAAVNRSPGFFTFETLRLAWQPRIDGNILKRSPFESIENGQYAKVRS